MGYSSFNPWAGGYYSRPPGPADFAPDHYFMPSQRKYQGEVLRVYVDYNKGPGCMPDLTNRCLHGLSHDASH